MITNVKRMKEEISQNYLLWNLSSKNMK